MSIRYSCKGDDTAQPDGQTLTFNRNKCLVYLPEVPTHIRAYQSTLVLVRPQQSLDLELRQAELRIAENGVDYRYTIDASRTKIADLSSDTSGDFEIRIKSHETAISEYRY